VAVVYPKYLASHFSRSGGKSMLSIANAAEQTIATICHILPAGQLQPAYVISIDKHYSPSLTNGTQITKQIQ